MVENKDVITSVVGASAGLSGLGLVFVGLLITTYQSFAGDTPERVLSGYRTATVGALSAFGAGVLCLCLAVGWLITRGDVKWLYGAAVTLFGLQILALVTSTVWTVKRLVWDS